MTQHPQALTCLVELLLFLFHRKFFCEKGLTDPSFWDKILVESVPWFALGVLLGACSPDGVARVPFLCQNSLAVYRRHRARNSIKKDRQPACPFLSILLRTAKSRCPLCWSLRRKCAVLAALLRQRGRCSSCHRRRGCRPRRARRCSRGHGTLIQIPLHGRHLPFRPTH